MFPIVLEKISAATADKMGMHFAHLMMFALSASGGLVPQPTRDPQEPALMLQITAPANGTIVSPGQTLPVTVTSSTLKDAQFAIVSPLGMGPLVSLVPGRTTLVVPRDAACRRYQVTAFGVIPSGQNVMSRPIEIDVERPDMPVAVSEQNDSREFNFQGRGESDRLTMLARFADGQVFDVTESSYLEYSSSDVRVATVDQYGLITAMGIGEATVKATYRKGAESRSMEFSVQLDSLDLTATPDSLDFGSQTVGAPSGPKQIVVTNTSYEPMRVTTVRATEDFAATDNCISSSPLPAGGTCVVSVTFAPRAAGIKRGMLLIESDRTVMPDPTPLKGTGIRR